MQWYSSDRYCCIFDTQQQKFYFLAKKHSQKLEMELNGNKTFNLYCDMPWFFDSNYINHYTEFFFFYSSFCFLVFSVSVLPALWITFPNGLFFSFFFFFFFFFQLPQLPQIWVKYGFINNEPIFGYFLILITQLFSRKHSTTIQ